MNQEKYDMFRNRLAKVIRHLKKLAKRQNVTCFRVYDHDLPEFPFCIEIYEDQVCLAEYKRHFEMGEGEHQEWLIQCIELISQVLDIPQERMHMRQRNRKEGRMGQYVRMDNEQKLFVVHEAGLKFWINLTDYLDTGLFLDHRLTRELVRTESKNKRVLNLFSYTGSFSVYAAAGGAASVTSVDLSKTYLNWAKKNMELNELICIGKHHFIQADVMQFLNELKTDQFDLVILDPPTFSNSKRMNEFLDIQRDHADLLNRTLQTMKSGGTLYFSTNFRKFQLDLNVIRASSVKDISKATLSFDFQARGGRFCYRLVK
jgi:23S rRNA (cytosine1962-C5)-methyltransferase